MEKKFSLLQLSILIFILLFSTNLTFSQNGKDNTKLIKTPQQSTTGKYRPENVSKGIIGKSSKNQVLVNGVPSYLWQHGCGPTALGMVIGYYDIHGYPELMIGDASTQTTYVNSAIANNDHYNDYSEPIDYFPDLYADKSELGGAHISNCIADYMHTSWSLDANRYGWSYSNKVSDAFAEYVDQQSSYSTYVNYENYNSGSWDMYKAQINNNRPVVLLVDTDGDAETDHFVTGIGYDDSNNKYGIYDTWDDQIHWYQWRPMSTSYSWGIYGFNILHIYGGNAQSDLAPHRPVSINYVWDDKIIIKNTTVNSGYQDMHDDQIVYGDDIYLSFSYLNDSEVNINDNFEIKILIDGIEEFNVYQTQLLEGYHYWMWWNQAVSTNLQIGYHTVKIIVDSDNNIFETDENNNEYTKTFDIVASANTNNLDKNKIEVFPNPVSDKLFLKTKYNLKNSKVEIYNTAGQIVKYGNLNSKQINVNNLEKGIYILKISNNNYNFYNKFIIER